MKVTATVENSLHKNIVSVETNENSQQISIPSKFTGYGSSVNGGELLCVALATCFCNDIYREANKRNIKVTKVVVEASAEFLAEGAAGSNIVYHAKIEGDASNEELLALVKHTDTVAEVHNTLRSGVKISLLL
ncbi:osmotically inducible protein OsmC [Pontibacter sp. SGAir0037]|nr:osmotically inducible protein OsmC [Pontibacter sp. SGAir0037]